MRDEQKLPTGKGPIPLGGQHTFANPAAACAFHPLVKVVSADDFNALRDALTAARAEAEALRRDAERYRWLRVEREHIGAEPFIGRRHPYNVVSCWTGLEIDRAIDAAMRGR